MAVRAEEMSMATKGKAMVLAIGTATPPNYIYQSDYPDYYFRVTNSEHLVELKDKLKRICDGTMIRKRHFHLTEEMLENNRSIAAHKEPSLDARQDIVQSAVPNLGKEAAARALQEWGLPKSKITHLVFYTSTGCVNMPGPDLQIVKLLGLNPCINRYMLFTQGCFSGGTVIRLAKDLAENNPGARVLVITTEIFLTGFRGPSETHIDTLVAQALFGDGAGAVIVGSDPDLAIEKPLYEIISACQTLLPGTEDALCGRVTEAGLTIQMSNTVPKHISMNVHKCLLDAFTPLGIADWNSIFFIVHPGGRMILDAMEEELKLSKEKLLVTRHVLAEYGNMGSTSVLFVMDEMRKQSAGKATTGEGADFGVLLGFGPGLTIETVVLHAL